MAAALLVLRLYNGQARLLDWNMADFWHWYGPAAATSLVLLILVVVDTVRMSNRIVGPLIRLRREMRHLAAGEAAKTIHFRVGDFWQEFAEEFNAVAQRMELLEAQASRAGTVATKADESGARANECLTRIEATRPVQATS
jgi:methyl-accepting chemotaxis protein